MTSHVEEYRKAGRVVGTALHAGAGLVEEGVSYLEVAEQVEDMICAEAGMAFPVNISVNEVAAHYTPEPDDKRCFAAGDVVKLDAGAHVDGYIGDAALTVAVGGGHDELIAAAREALDAAIGLVRAGVTIAELGGHVEDTITSHGFRPVENLQGHSLERYNLHAGLSIPSVANDNTRRLTAGEVVAIEPFATDGAGRVVNGDSGNIYHMIGRGRGKTARAMQQRFDGLPFASRWMDGIVPRRRIDLSLAFLQRRRVVRPYSMLVEADGGLVAQAEHTLLVTEDGCEILTRTE
ncbi:MAG: type II methionyl aminopeptidase [Thermoplasmatota archaeon]